MKTVRIKAEHPYNVLIGKGMLSQAGERLLAALKRPCAVALLTDDTVDALYGQAVQNALEAHGFRVSRMAVAHGEKHKTLAVWESMLDFLARERFTRADCVAALGGGVVGDMAGFAAATYLRGVAYVQIPTTLLAMVDSSVGGKTGVNLHAGKNLAGAFYQPRLVLCDPHTLETLPAATLADGVAEAVKYGVLQDRPLFDVMLAGEWQNQTAEVIERCVAAKGALVAQDERDTGRRQLLNLGHTLGHAIEKCSDFSVSHGRAVAVGMVYAARLAQRLGLCDLTVTREIVAALENNGLPTSAPYGAEELCEAALIDKKRAGDTLTFVLPREIGKCELYPAPVAELPRLVRLAVNP